MKLKRILLNIAGLLLIASCAENMGSKMTETKATEEMTKEESIEIPTIETAFEFIKSSGGIDEYRCALMI